MKTPLEYLFYSHHNEVGWSHTRVPHILDNRRILFLHNRRRRSWTEPTPGVRVRFTLSKEGLDVLWNHLIEQRLGRISGLVCRCSSACLHNQQTWRLIRWSLSESCWKKVGVASSVDLPTARTNLSRSESGWSNHFRLKLITLPLL